jgi:hypothetical protein
MIIVCAECPDDNASREPKRDIRRLISARAIFAHAGTELLSLFNRHSFQGFWFG